MVLGTQMPYQNVPGLPVLMLLGLLPAGHGLHTWWICPKDAFGYGSIPLYNIPKDAQMTLLNTPVDDIPRHMQTLIHFMFLGGKTLLQQPGKAH